MKPVREYKLVEKTYYLGAALVRLGARAVDAEAVKVYLDEQEDLALGSLVTMERGPRGGLVFVPQTPPLEVEKALPWGSAAEGEASCNMNEGSFPGDPAYGKLPDLRGGLTPVPEAWAPESKKKGKRQPLEEGPQEPPPGPEDEGDDFVAFPPG